MNKHKVHIGIFVMSVLMLLVLGMSYAATTLDYVVLSPDKGMFGENVTVITNNATDLELDNIKLMCGNESDNYNLCNSTFGQPQRNCTFESPWNDDTSHTIYCRMTDGVNQSLERNVDFYSDNTPPTSWTILNLDGDLTPKYWDRSPGTNTIAQINFNESGIRCRYSNTDVEYDAISSSNECSVSGSVVSCNLWSLVGQQINHTTKYISCEDEFGNNQNTSQNIDISFGIDWTKPSVNVNYDGLIHSPGYSVNMTIFDMPTDALVNVVWCNSTISGCVPYSGFSGVNGTYETVTFNERGNWYLRFNATDAAENINETKEVVISINQVINVSKSTLVNVSGHGFDVFINTSDNNSMQDINCTLYHRQSGIGAYTLKDMSLFFGVEYDGVWKGNVSIDDGYNVGDIIDTYVNCTDGQDPVDNMPIVSNEITNFAPVLSNIPTQIFNEDNNLTINLTDYFDDPDGDDLNFTSTNVDNVTIIIDNVTDTIKFVPDKNFYGARTVNITSYEEYGFVNTSNTFSLQINPVNDAPTEPNVTLLPIKPINTDDIVCNITNESYDAEGDTIYYWFEWYKNGVFNRSVKQVLNYDIIYSSEVYDGDSWRCNVTATDNIENSTTVSLSVTVGNAAPTFDHELDNISVYEDEAVYYDVNCSDLNFDTIEYLDNTSLFDIDNETGEISFSPLEASVGNHTVEIMCRDAEDNNTDLMNVEIKNVGPEISSEVLSLDSYSGELFSYDFNTTDDTDTLVWSVNSTMMSINSTTGLINDTPLEAEYGIYNINVSVVDQWGALDSLVFSYNINDIISPNILLVPPSPINDSRQVSNIVYVNATISETNVLSECLLEINGSNYTMSIIGNNCNASFVTTDATSYQFRVFAKDDSNNWNSSEVRFFRENAKPEIVFMNITPNPSNMHSILSCNSVWSDLDSDASSYYYRWFNSSSVLVGENSQTFNCSSFGCDKGDNITCEAVPYDGYENGTAQNTSITITNSLPVVSSLPQINILEDSYNDTLNLSNYVYDIDNQISNINWTYSGNTQNFTITIDNNSKVLNVTPNSNWFGTSSITLCAHDVDLGVGCNTTNVVVTGVNDKPTWTTINIVPTVGKYGSNVTVYSVGADDVDYDNYQLRCGESDFNWNLCNSSYGVGERNCTFNSPWLGDVSHDIYCRLYENDTSYSERRYRPYEADNTVPDSFNLQTIDGDVSMGGYWDTSNNSATLVIGNITEVGTSCRWSSSDVSYDLMNSANSCLVVGTVIECNMTGVSQGLDYNYHIACADQYGNGHNVTENTGFNFSVDWTAPITFDTHSGGIQLPGYSVIINESDIPVGTTINTWYCVDQSGTCVPSMSIDDADNVTFDSSKRGINHLRYYSNDSATPPNTQSPLKDTTIMINRLLNVDSFDTVNNTHSFDVNVNISDMDSQSISCSIYHRKGSESYNVKAMNNIAGTLFNGTWNAEILPSDGTGLGYMYGDIVEYYVSCNDSMEIVNSSVSYNKIPNTKPVMVSIQDNVTYVKSGDSIGISTSSYDPDLDSLRLFVCNSTSANYSGCLDTEYCSDIVSINDSSCSFTAVGGEGTYVWHAFLYDSFGEIAAFNYTGNYTIDDIAPVITLNLPLNNNASGNVTPSFTFNATDNNFNLLNCTLYVNSSNRGNVTATSGSISEIVSETLVEGKQLWKIGCYDGVGNYNESELRNITIDITAPKSNITLPQDMDEILVGDKYNITADATDLSSVASVDFIIDLVSYSGIYNGSSWVYEWNLSDGKYEIISRAIDALGNVENISLKENIIVYVYSNSTINNSDVNESEIVNSEIINSTVINDSVVKDSNLTNVTSYNCTIIDSVLANTVCEDSIVINFNGENSYIDPSHVENVTCNTNCTIIDSTVINVDMNNSIVNDSYLRDCQTEGISWQELYLANVTNELLGTGNVTYLGYVYDRDDFTQDWSIKNIYAQCGDGNCSSGSHTASCAADNNYPNCNFDCGACAPAPTGGSSGGGGGGSSRREACRDGIDNDGDGLIDWPEDPGCEDRYDDDEFNVISQTCNEDWTCSDWSECEDGMQARECGDWNDCGTQEYMPRITRECEVEEVVNYECMQDYDCDVDEICVDNSCAPYVAPQEEIPVVAPEDKKEFTTLYDYIKLGYDKSKGQVSSFAIGSYDFTRDLLSKIGTGISNVYDMIAKLSKNVYTFTSSTFDDSIIPKSAFGVVSNFVGGNTVAIIYFIVLLSLIFGGMYSAVYLNKAQFYQDWMSRKEEERKAKVREQYARQLNSFLASMVSRGYTKGKILGIMKEHGWPLKNAKQYVDKYFDANKEDIEYIKDQIKEQKRQEKFRKLNSHMDAVEEDLMQTHKEHYERFRNASLHDSTQQSKEVFGSRKISDMINFNNKLENEKKNFYNPKKEIHNRNSKKFEAELSKLDLELKKLN